MYPVIQTILSVNMQMCLLCRLPNRLDGLDYFPRVCLTVKDSCAVLSQNLIASLTDLL